MKVSEIFNSIYDDEFGYRPATGNLKPAHVANTFARNVIAKQYDTKAIQIFIRSRDTYNNGYREYEDRKFEAMVDGKINDTSKSHNISLPLDQFSDYSGHKHEFENLRKFIEGLVNADDAFYGFKNSNMLCSSFSNKFMITSAKQCHDLGTFCANILQDTNLQKMFNNHINTNDYSDPLSKLLSPLRGNNDEKFIPKEFTNIINKDHNREIIKIFKEISENLYLHVNEANSLRSIRRVVQFISLLPILHVQAVAANGVLEKRPLLVLTSDIHPSSNISKLSAYSIHNLFFKLHEWLTEKLSIKLKEKKHLTSDPNKENEIKENYFFPNELDTIIDALKDNNILEIASNITNEKKKTICDNRLNIYEQEFKNNFNTKDNDLKIAKILNTIFITESQWEPKKYYRQLAKKIGFFYPHYQEKEKSVRIYPNTSIKDLLLRLLIRPDEGMIPLSEFLIRLRTKLGIVVGDNDDHLILNNQSLSVDIETLEKNKNNFVNDLEKIGLAKKYADNETLVGFEYG